MRQIARRSRTYGAENSFVFFYQYQSPIGANDIGRLLTKAIYANKLCNRILVKFLHRFNEVAGIALIIVSFVLLDKLVTHFVFSAPQ